MAKSVLVAVLLSVVLLCTLGAHHAEAAGFYLPGISPRDYFPGDEVWAKVNSLRSLSQLIPFDYYKGPFCKPAVVIANPQSLGEVITGDKVQTSLYSFNMLKNESCRLLPCAPGADDLVRSNIKEFEKLINNGYRGYINIDNLPIYNPGVPILDGRCTGAVPVEQTYPFQRGYALGVHKNCIGETLINNHIHFTIKYHTVLIDDKPMHRVVGLSAVPASVKHNPDGGDCDSGFDAFGPQVQYLSVTDMKSADRKVWWSYGVTWIEEPSVTWAMRWDEYLNTSVADSNAQVHWQYIIVSLIVTICLSFVASVNLMRALHRDYNRYNSSDPDDNQEEIGWKLVHADVFRPPQYAKVLSAIVGTGVQITLMVTAVIFFALLGLLSPAARGMLLTAIILMYALLSITAGYVCGKLLMMFDLKEWRAVFLCGTLFPGGVFCMYLFVDILNMYAGASDAVPLLTLFTLFFLWVGISIPLTMIGASFAFRQPAIEPAVKVGRLAREVPEQRVQHSAPFIWLIPPLAPLGCAMLELKFIYASVWQGMVYYVFGFLAIVFVVWCITVILTTLVTVYYMLCYENYHWWWSSVIIPGGLGLHLMLYSVYYFTSQTEIEGFTGTCIYFAVMWTVAAMYGMVAGTLGFFSSLVFARTIYSNIKVD